MLSGKKHTDPCTTPPRRIWGVINAKIRIHNIFWRGYFCYGGGGVSEVEGCKVCVLEGVLLLWRRGCF